MGGTPDNPDVVDKEAGLIALDAFLALYDATQQDRWLACAIQASHLTVKRGFTAGRSQWQWATVNAISHADETRVVSALLPLDTLVPMPSWPITPSSSTGCYPIIPATPTSVMLLKYSLHNTKQTIDLDGSLGYASTGLQTEAMTIAVHRGHSVRLWLPWLTVAAIDPLVQLKDTFFGSFSIDEIEARSDGRSLGSEIGNTDAHEDLRTFMVAILRMITLSTWMTFRKKVRRLATERWERKEVMDTVMQ